MAVGGVSFGSGPARSESGSVSFGNKAVKSAQVSGFSNEAPEFTPGKPGPDGEPGPRGDPGPDGNPGPDGEDFDIPFDLVVLFNNGLAGAP